MQEIEENLKLLNYGEFGTNIKISISFLPLKQTYVFEMDMKFLEDLCMKEKIKSL